MKSTKLNSQYRLIFSKIIFIIIISLFSFQHLPAQEPSEEEEKAQAKEMEKQALEAQKKAMEQLKQMGIDIDPNKEMTEEDAKKMKDKILKKTKDWQKQAEKQIDEYDQMINNVPVHKDVALGKVPTKDQMLTIAERFFQRSYKKLNAIEKSEFDKDFKAAEKDKFSIEAVRKLGNKGAELITFGDNHYFACVYITSAVKAIPTDTLSVNNFGGYLRIIDSLEVSIPVLLYANELFSESPVILTQLGCSLLEMGDEVKAEKYLKLALKFNPDFGQANSALTEVYIRQKKFKEALQQLFAGCKNMGVSYQQASLANQQIQNGYEKSTPGDDLKGKEEFWDETQKQTQPSGDAGPMPKTTGKVKMPAFPDCKDVDDWLLGGGYSNAVMAHKAFHDFMMDFVKEFGKMHEEKPNIPPNATLRDYPNERLALDCISQIALKLKQRSIIKLLKRFPAGSIMQRNYILRICQNIQKNLLNVFKDVQPIFVIRNVKESSVQKNVLMQINSMKCFSLDIISTDKHSAVW
jgi:tetratricopeptide (TPR) repeat protein